MRTNFQMENENITMVKGDTLAFNIEVFDENDNPMTVDSCDFTCKKNIEGEEAIFHKMIGAGISQSGGVLTVRVAPADTAEVDAGRYFYDIRLGVDNDYYTVRRGILDIEQNVTSGDEATGYEWDKIENKPFESIGAGLDVNEGALYVPMDDVPVENSIKVVKSGGVFTALSTKVDKVQGKGLSTNDYTDADKTIVTGVPTALDGKVDNTTLNNYYTKTQVDNIVEAIKNGRFVVVQELPTTDIQTNVIYLVPKSTAGTNNSYDEYVNTTGTTAGWEKIGDTDIDLSGYVTDSELETALSSKADATDVSAIEDMIPSTASSSNKLATASDIPSTANFVEKSLTAGLLKNDGTVDTTAYAKQSEMSVTAGTGADADKTTIQLKSGTSATVLTQHQDISGKADKVIGATSGNFAGLDANGDLTDTGKKPSDFLTQHQDISGKQNKTLDTAITVDGTQETTVEGALEAINTLAGANKTALADKVDKVNGKGLSTNDYTNADKAIVTNIHDELQGAEVIQGKNYLNVEYSEVSGIKFPVDSDGYITANPNNADSRQWNYNNSNAFVTLEADIYELYLECKTSTTSSYSHAHLMKESDSEFVVINDMPTAGNKVKVEFTLSEKTNLGFMVKAFDGAFRAWITKKSDDSATYIPYYIPLKDSMFPRSEQAVLGAKNLLENNATVGTYNGIARNVNADKSLTFSGTASANEWIGISQANINNYALELKKDVTYIMSSGVTLPNGCVMHLRGEGDQYLANIQGSATEVSYTPTADVKCNIAVRINNGTVISNAVTIYPMLRLASDPDDTYVPYAMTNKELTIPREITLSSIAGTQESTNGRRIGKLIDINIGMDNVTLDANGVLCKIPVDVAPSNNMSFFGYNTSDNTPIRIYVTNTGDIKTASALSNKGVRGHITYIQR